MQIEKVEFGQNCGQWKQPIHCSFGKGGCLIFLTIWINETMALFPIHHSRIGTLVNTFNRALLILINIREQDGY